MALKKLLDHLPQDGNVLVLVLVRHQMSFGTRLEVRHLLYKFKKKQVSLSLPLEQVKHLER